MSGYPSSLVDLRVGEVKLSGLPHQHDVRRQATLRQELESLWKGYGGSDYPTRSVPAQVSIHKGCIAKLRYELILGFKY